MRKKRKEGEETSYWLSYSDMMAALLLTFVLIISFTVLQAKSQYEMKERELRSQQMKLSEQQERLQEQEKILANQQGLLKEQQEIMKSQQEHLDNLIGVREDVIVALKNEFEGTNLSVSIDPQTGAITFDSNLLFEFNKYDLKKAGVEFLEEFLPRYISVLLSPEYESYISEIIIEGHTDTVGDYLSNLSLSQKRALAVANYCLSEDSILSIEEVMKLRTIVTANGRSFSTPIYNEDGTVNMDASRRVEVKFRLKDEEMIKEMIGILGEE